MLGIHSSISEILSSEREVCNIHETFAVAMYKDGKVVGHSLRKFQHLNFYKTWWQNHFTLNLTENISTMPCTNVSMFWLII